MQHAEHVLSACARYIFGEETGESGTPHLQGAVKFNTKQRFTAVTRLFPGKGVHWEKMKKPWKNSVIYCTKEMAGNWEKIHGNIPEASRLRPHEQAIYDHLYKSVVWRSWQQDVITIVDGPADARKIHWFWEPEGNSGKSFLTKYLYLTYEVVIGGGKATDVFHQLAKRFETDPVRAPKLILLDIPRESMKWISYAAVEKMKDGLVVSGKYEGCICCYDPPHVVIFANEPPTYTGTFSEDRWVVKRLYTARTVGQALRNGISRNLIV